MIKEVTKSVNGWALIEDAVVFLLEHIQESGVKVVVAEVSPSDCRSHVRNNEIGVSARFQYEDGRWISIGNGMPEIAFYSDPDPRDLDQLCRDGTAFLQKCITIMEDRSIPLDEVRREARTWLEDQRWVRYPDSD